MATVPPVRTGFNVFHLRAERVLVGGGAGLEQWQRQERAPG